MIQTSAILDLKQQEIQLHTSLDNLRGDRKKLRDYRDCDKQLREIIRKRRNLEAAAQFDEGVLARKANSEEVGIVLETVITPGGHAEVWVAWFSIGAENINLGLLRSLLIGGVKPLLCQDFIYSSFIRGTVPVVEQPELLQCLLQQDTTLQEEVGIVQRQLQPDISQSGQSSLTNTQLLLTESDSPKQELSKPTQLDLATNLSSDSKPQTCLSLEALVRICPLLEKEPDLMAIALACFLKQSDFCDYKSLRVSYLKMSPDSSPAITEVTLNKSSAPSLNWGIWGLGNLETESNGLPKAESESFLWVLTGNVQCTAISPNRPTLQDCLESPNAAILHRSQSGDRIYTEFAPTLRSCGSTNGHQGGSGAWKVREEDGTLRPLRPTECERLMGWEVDRKTVILEVWNRPYADPPSSCVDAAQQCPKKPSAVGSAEKTEKNEPVLFAATSSQSKSRNELKPVEVLVDYNLEDKGIVLRTTLTSPLSVPIAELQRVLDHQKSDAFALANVFLYLIQAKRTVNGKAESRASDKALEAQLNGRICVEKYGLNIEENVNAVVKCINQVKNFSRFTISAVGVSSQNCDLSLQTLSCFVVNVINGFIPEQIRSKSSYVLKIEYSVGCTKYGLTEDGRVIEISNTQRIKMLGNGIVPAEIEDICNNLKPILEAMKQSNVIDFQPEVDNQTNYGMMGEMLPVESLATADGSESIINEDSAMDNHTISGTAVAAKNFSVGDRVKSVSPVYPNATCTIAALPSKDAAIVELEDGGRERLLLKHLEPLNKPDYLPQVTESSSARFEIIEQLSPDEERERHRLELKVERAFYEAGCALREIREKRLYRSTHKTFEAYCKERFGFNRMAAHFKISAATTWENLYTIGIQTLPTSERQVRELTKLEPEEQRTCWQQAVDLADGKVPTGKIVKGVVERLLEKPLNFASEYCSVGEIFRLQRLTDNDKKYNGWWGIALEVENRLTVKCQVYDTTIEIRQNNIKRIDMTKEELEKQQEIIERVSRLARCNLDTAAWALLETLNRQVHHTDYQLQMLKATEEYYGIHAYEN